MTDEEAIKEFLIQRHKAGIDNFFEEILGKLKFVKNDKKECQEMTDNEIIKALKCCASETTELTCGDCPLCDTRKPDCHFVNAQNALDLINRQEAENERLNKEVDRLSQCVLYHEGQIVDAIKDFAERLKERYIYVTPNEIDNLVKEMTESEGE